MLFKYATAILLLVYLTNCEDGYLPPYIKPCRYQSKDFIDCIMEQIKVSLPKFTKGIPEMDVPSIDPVKLDDILIDGNGLKLTFTEAAMHGLSKSKLTDMKMNIGKGKGEETLSLSFKSDFSLTAKYAIDGKILILPIQGKGDARVEAQGVEVKLDTKLMHVKDDKGYHLKLVSPNYKYTIDRTTFDLQNLFNGNKELAATTLQFANENWQQLMDELSPPAIKQIVRTVVKVINKFFSKVTLQQIFLGYTEEN